MLFNKALDLAVKANMSFRLPIVGPLEQADLGGYLEKFIDPKKYPKKIKEMIEKAEIGPKSGKGFYQ